MGKQLFIGLAAEGNTDIRFLKSVVLRTYLRIVFDECDQDIDVEVFEIKASKVGKTFPQFVVDASKYGVEKYGILVLAVHSDSDKDTLQERLEDKFVPANNAIALLNNDSYCKVIVPIVPIRMIEAWMLADTSLVKEEIGTALSDSELGLHRDPESVAYPKRVLQDAISTVMLTRPKKRRSFTIGDLYGILGDKVSIEALSRLPSYMAFYSAAKDSLIRIHYLP